MKNNKAAILGELVQKEIGSIESDSVQVTHKSFFWQALGKVADKLGKSIGQVLAETQEAMQTSIYPGPDCLKISEVEDYADKGSLDDPFQKSHLQTCEKCSDLLSSVRFDNGDIDTLESLLAAVNTVAALEMDKSIRMDTYSQQNANKTESVADIMAFR
jgi:hypothetical protein